MNLTKAAPRPFEADIKVASKRLIAVALFAVLLTTGCWAFTTATNKVVGGNLVYFYFRKHATSDIEGLHFGLNGGDANATLDFMAGFAISTVLSNQWAKLTYYVTDFDYFFENANNNDFATAANDIRYTDRCLVMHRNTTPFGDHHNWTYRSPTDGHCTWGSHF